MSGYDLKPLAVLPPTPTNHLCKFAGNHVNYHLQDVNSLLLENHFFPLVLPGWRLWKGGRGVYFAESATATAPSLRENE